MMVRHNQFGAVQTLVRAWRMVRPVVQAPQVRNVTANAKYHLIISRAWTSWTAVLLLAGAIAAPAAPAVRIPIAVDFPDGAETAWPVACGVPFPSAILPDAAALRVVDDAGAPVPAQVDTTATWLAGSVRWVLLHFAASGFCVGDYRIIFL